MKMQNAEMEFVAFDAQDVIATSGTPLAFATGDSLSTSEQSYITDKTNKNAIDIFNYYGDSEVLAAINSETNKWFAITSAQKLDDGLYGVTFDPHSALDTKPDNSASILGSASSGKELNEFLANYFNRIQ